MKTRNVVIGSAVGGAALAMLLTPRKGSELRSMILKMPGSILTAIRNPLSWITGLFSLAKKETSAVAKKATHKPHPRAKKATSKKAHAV